jgi:large subunit ribosomal protein L6
MIPLFKKKIQIQNKIFFKSSLGKIQIYLIDQIIPIPKYIHISIQNQNLFFRGLLGKCSLTFQDHILFFFKKNKLILIINLQKNKKSILNLYNKLIKIKIKGVLQGFKLNLILKGIGFKTLIENNHLIFKIGFSHPIILSIPEKIKIINQSNNLIFNSIDYIYLTEFVHYIKNLKKPEPYKGKGFLFKNEKIFKKEGKKNKK